MLQLWIPDRSTRRLAIRYSAAAAAAYALYWWLTTEEDDNESEDELAERHASGKSHLKQRRPSFSVADEHGEMGAISDERAQSWGWLVDTKPAPGEKRAVLKSTELEREARLGATEPATKKAVRFSLDKRSNFYGFVFNYDGTCIAHGAEPSFVGLSLSQVLQRTKNTDVDGAELNRRFVSAAEKGGDFVSYAWRHDASSTVRLKGAFITPLRAQYGQQLYAGVGYSLVPPPPGDPASGLYGFVCDPGEGRMLAHGASPRFVGMSLAEIIADTGNDQLDADRLLARFRAAARLGGGWVTYPWRNGKADPMRQKGAYISRIERPPAGGSNATSPSASLCNSLEVDPLRAAAMAADAAIPAAGDETDDGTRPYPVEATESEYTEYLIAGVGYFGEPDPSTPPSGGSREPSPGGSRHRPPIPPPVPPSAAAARAATAALKRQVSEMRVHSKEQGGRSGGGGWSRGEGGARQRQEAALAAVVSDTSGALASAAAEVACWEATAMPEELQGLLREHCTAHIRQFDHAAPQE